METAQKMSNQHKDQHQLVTNVALVLGRFCSLFECPPLPSSFSTNHNTAPVTHSITDTTLPMVKKRASGEVQIHQHAKYV